MNAKNTRFEILVLVLCLIGGAARIAAAEPGTVIVAAATTDPQVANIVPELLEGLVKAAPGGTRLIVLDAVAQKRLADFEIFESRQAAARMNHARRQCGTLLKHLAEPRSVRQGESGQVNLPLLVSTIATTLRDDASAPRLVIVGSAFYADSREPNASFAAGQVPSDEHIRVDSMTSIWGTSDRHGQLQGVLVDWVVIGDTGTQRERRAVERFYNLYLGELGASLGTFGPSSAGAVDRVTKGLTDRIAEDSLDPDDNVLAIRTIKPIASNSPAASRSGSAPVSLDTPVRHDVDLVILVDGTSSMGPALLHVGEMAKRLARLGAKLTPRFSVGIVVYRGAGRFSVLEPTEVRRTVGDVDKYVGIEAVDRFVDEPQLLVTIVASQDGERAGPRSGESKLASHMTGLISFADIEGGVDAGCRMLLKGEARRKVLLLVGDVGASESDQKAGMSASDHASADHTLRTLRSVAEEEDDVRIIALFAGSSDTPDAGETISFFKRLSGLAGRHGVFLDSMSEVDEAVTRAMLAP